MVFNLALLNESVRQNLNQIGFDHYDDQTLYNDLKAAYDFIVILADRYAVDLTALRESSLKRCVINLATFYGYRTYTRLAERIDGTLPETAALTVMYDQNNARVCLETLLGIKLDDDLSPIESSAYVPCSAEVGSSILDYEYD